MKIKGDISLKNPPGKELQAALAWRKMFEKLVNNDEFKKANFPGGVENLVNDWIDNKALSGTYGKDIFIWLGLYNYLSNQSLENVSDTMGKFINYYTNVSLKRTEKVRKDGGSYFSRDPLNWSVAAAMDYVDGANNDLSQVYTKYKIDRKKQVEKFASMIKEEGLDSLKNINSRLVGRLMLLKYMSSRKDFSQERQVNEVTLIMLLKQMKTSKKILIMLKILINCLA